MPVDTARTKRLVLIELCIFLTLAGTTALLFRPLMTVISQNTAVIRKELVKRGELFFNRPIRYGSMSPSLLGSLEIRDISLGEGPVPLVDIEYLYLEYSLWDLIRGRGTGALRSVVLEKPEFSYDGDRDRDLGDLFSPAKSPRASPVLPPECTVRLNGGNLTIIRGKVRLDIARIDLNGSLRDGRITLDGRWQKPLAVPEGSITLEGTLNGECSDTFTDGTITLSIDSLEGEGFRFHALGFALIFFEDRIALERLPDGLPLKLSAVYVPQTGTFSGAFSADRFVLRNMVSFFGPLEKLRYLLGLRLSGRASFFLSSRLSYDFSFVADHEKTDSIPVRGFVLAGSGNREKAAFSRFRIDANRGFAEYSGDLEFTPVSPQGTVTFSGFTLTGDGAVNGTLALSRTEQGISLRSPYLSLGGVPVSNLGGDLAWEQGAWNLGFDRFREDPYSGVLERSFFTAGGFINREQDREQNREQKPGRLEGSVRLGGFFASDMINLARPFVTLAPAGTWARRTAVTTEVFFTTDFEQVSYTTYRFLAAYGGRATLSASVSGTGTGFEISGGKLDWRKGQVAFGFSADFSDAAVLFRSHVSYRDFVYDFEGSILDRRTLTIRGPNITADVRLEDTSLSGSVLLSSVPVPYRGHRAYLNLDAALRYYNPRQWNVNLKRLEIVEQRDPLHPAAILVRGGANQNGFNLDRVSFNDRYGPLEGTAAAVWDSGFSFIDGSCFLAGETETETLAASVFYNAGTLEYNATVKGFKADRIAESGKNLQVDGDIFGMWNRGGSYSVNLSLDSLSGRNGEKPFSLSARALLNPEQLIVSQISGSMGEVEALVPYVSVDRGAGRLETEGQINGRINEQNGGVSVSLGANFRPMEGWLDLRRAVDAFSGIIEVRHAYLNNRESSGPFTFIFSRTREEENAPSLFRLSGGPEDMLRLEFRESPRGSMAEGLGEPGMNGMFTLAMSAPSPVQGTITGTLAGTELDAWAQDVFVDLAGLWEIIPVNKVVNFTGGFISGETRIHGSIFDPEFEGTAWGSGVSLQVPEYVSAGIGPGTGDIILDGSELSFGPLSALCGTGSGEITGWIRFNRWVPSLNLTIVVQKPIPFNFDIAGVRARGNALGDLNLSMENKEIMTITGNIDADDTEITLDAVQMEAALSGTVETHMDVITDVHITAGRRVEFLWPSTETPFLRAYGDAGTGVRITGDTRIPHFALDGDISLRGGELYHLQRSFYIREGQIDFNGNDPRIDPRISARAETRDRNDEGPVTITMIVDNMPLSELLTSIPRYESTPALSQSEIYSLLGQAPPTGTETVVTNANPFLGTLAEMVLQTVVFRRVERQIRNILGVDMFSFRTQILQNTIFEAIRDREPGEQPSTMGNYLDNTAVFVGKYIGEELFFQGIISFRYDQYRKEYGGMILEPEIGLDMRTPLFDVRWNVALQHPEDLFVSDQSISLVWRWSL
jgi:hypothetical protein